MSNHKTRSKATAQHKGTGFSLDYACSFTVRKGKHQAHASADARRKEKEG